MKTSAKDEPFEFYQYAFKDLVNYTYILDTEGQLIFCNAKLLKVFNLDKIPNPTIGLLYSLMLDNHFGNPYQLASLKKMDIESLVSESPSYSEHPVEFWLNNEKTHLFDIKRSPILGSSGQSQGLLVELIDVTEKIYLHEQLDKIRKELAQKNSKASGVIPPSPFSFNRKNALQETTAQSPLVLVIEDDEVAQKSVKSVLMHCNFNVHFAHNEAEFNALFEPGKYQLVLMDIGLEETSGYMVAKSIRKIEANTEYSVPIIALTGYDPKNLTGDCKYYTMEGAIQKPLTVIQASEINQRYIHHIDISITGLEAAKPNT